MANRAFPLLGKNRPTALKAMSEPQIVREWDAAQDAIDMMEPGDARIKGLRAYTTRCKNELDRRAVVVPKYGISRVFIGSGEYWGIVEQKTKRYVKGANGRDILCYLEHTMATAKLEELNKEGENS